MHRIASSPHHIPSLVSFEVPDSMTVEQLLHTVQQGIHRNDVQLHELWMGDFKPTVEDMQKTVKEVGLVSGLTRTIWNGMED